jgi:hypothetical protein
MFVLGDTFTEMPSFQEPRMFIQALDKLLAIQPVAGPTSNRTYTCDDARRDSR